jgi:hypothetical protein
MVYIGSLHGRTVKNVNNEMGKQMISRQEPVEPQETTSPTIPFNTCSHPFCRPHNVEFSPTDSQYLQLVGMQNVTIVATNVSHHVVHLRAKNHQHRVSSRRAVDP